MQLNELNILFVEDTPEDAELAVLELERQGLSINWKRVDTEIELRNVLSTWRPHIILSDHSMPSFSGLDALEISREMAPEIPFIFVSGTIGEERAIESIHKGATDYVLKDNLRRLSTSVNRAISEAIEHQYTLQLDKERARLSKILETTPDMVVIINTDDFILYMNEGGRSLLGLGTEGLANLNIKDIHAEWAWDFVKNEVYPTVRRDGIWKGETVMVSRDGEEIPVEKVVISHKAEDDEIEFLSFIARDIRDRKDYENRIQYLANYDLLTGLPNRTLLTDRTEQAIVHCNRTERYLALLAVNIDRFKLINDGYGQKAGDSLLKYFGERLNTSVRTGDTIARLSGDNFVVLATELSSPDDVVNVVSKVQEGLKRPFIIDSNTYNLSTCIGVSVYPRDGEEFSSLLQHAELAMHRSKEKEDAKVQYYATEMGQNAAEKVMIETELRDALNRNELELYYQPQISLETGKIVGFEALMRWNHAERGLVSPGLFIPIAENSELILHFGEWALNEACNQLKAWDRSGKNGLRVSVNVSARQFLSQGFSEMVGRLFRTYELEPERLELELTESVLVHDQEEAIYILSQLDSQGVKIALDDFGTGYSNLSYLSRLPIHYLKIDQSFVNRCLVDKNDAEIVRAVITLSDSLNLGVIAEGIETVEQLNFLKGHHCGFGQGYLFSKPLPTSKIAAIMGKTFN